MLTVGGSVYCQTRCGSRCSQQLLFSKEKSLRPPANCLMQQAKISVPGPGAIGTHAPTHSARSNLLPRSFMACPIAHLGKFLMKYGNAVVSTKTSKDFFGILKSFGIMSLDTETCNHLG